MRIVLLLVLLAPTAQAVEALEAEPRLGAVEARLVVRAEGDIVVVADAPVRSELARISWHGLDDVTEIVLRRDANDPRSVEITDASGVGLLLEWPASDHPVPQPWFGAMVALGCAGLGRRLRAKGRLRACSPDLPRLRGRRADESDRPTEDADGHPDARGRAPRGGCQAAAGAHDR